MFAPSPKSRPILALLLLLSPLVAGCAGSVQSAVDRPPATTGTHTVMGRAYFPGGVMVLLDARLRDGIAGGTMQYSKVESRGDNTLRIDVSVECVGLFNGGSQAVIAGPVSRVDGDFRGIVGVRDWWFTQVEEGGPEGDLILSGRQDRDRALTLCHSGPNDASTLRAVDGDLSIY